MDAKDAPLSEFDSECQEDEAIEVGEVSRETQGGPFGNWPEGGGGYFKIG